MVDRMIERFAILADEIVREENRIAAKQEICRLARSLHEAIDAYRREYPDEPAMGCMPSDRISNSPANGQEGSDLLIESPVPPLIGRDTYEAVRWSLAQFGGWADLDELAKRAIKAGYRNPTSGDDVPRVARAFYDVMRRVPGNFEQHPINRRLFRLGEGDPE